MFGIAIFALIIGVIWLEVITFQFVGSQVGTLLTISGIFATAAIGLNLFRSTSKATFKRITAAIQNRQAPLFEVADGIAIVVAAGLLLIPGYATDALGLIMFIPKIRVVILIAFVTIIRYALPKFSTQTTFHFRNSTSKPSMNEEAASETIEGEYKRRE